jgi:tetratricopeptide (TPR) repeat protein
MTLLLLAMLTKMPGIFVNTDERKAVAVTCPLDGTKFTAYEIRATNQHGGRDADNCPHALKTSPLEYHVWACPSCGFAGLKRDFEQKLSEADRTALAGGLRPAGEIKRGAKQAEIPGHVKFDLLAQVATLRKSPPEQAGLAWLGASWCARQQGAPYLNDFEEWEKLRDVYNLNQMPISLGKKNRTDFDLEAARKVEKDIDAKKYEKGVNRTLSRYLAAYLHRKHGENAEAARWLDELEKLKGENSVVDEAAAAMRASIPVEQGYQKKALEGYRAACEAGSFAKPDAAEAAYLIGELHRRLGEKDAALQWFEKALGSTDDAGLKELVGKQKARLPK